MNRSRTFAASLAALSALLLSLLSGGLSGPAWASYPADPEVAFPTPRPPVPPPVADHRVLWVLAGVALLGAVLALTGAAAVLWQRHQAAGRLLPAA